ncbi:UrcA family protein [uncultured Croceicoccus sp.]|uniref:UrcA family protein n=1 Tax=uncultured Croceicoccus sp. TaxID=1295329 RepID=UPI0026279DF9|nr:UrcA family protein [uncultured Croceicoccus sp.]
MFARTFKKTFAPALTAAAVLAAPLVATSAHAEPWVQRGADKGVTKTVQVNDLDLSTEEGQRMLEKRVKAAAYDVCLYTVSGMVATPDEQKACVRIALQRSEGQMATAINNARYGG